MQLNPVHLALAGLFQARLFRIPDYQRAYSWQRRQRMDLFADIKEAHRTGRTHFMATVVGLAREKRTIGADEFSVIEIVDGQQRLTTLVILIKAIECALAGREKSQTRLRKELRALLVKGDAYNLLLLQTNHDSSDIFTTYIRTGRLKSDEVSTAADADLVDAVSECGEFVKEWNNEGSLTDLVFTIRNRLSVIYHELVDQSTVYRVFEVLNSRGLDVRWLDKTKSQLMALICEHVEEGSQTECLGEMQGLWKDIYRELGLEPHIGDEALRFAGTLAAQTRPNRIISDADAAAELLRMAGSSTGSIIEAARWLRTVVRKARALQSNPRLAAVTRIAHARFLAIAIKLREFDDTTEKGLLKAWENVTFRIFTLAGKDSRTRVGEYVRLGYDILQRGHTALEIADALVTLGDGYTIDDVIVHDTWENWYEGWTEEVRYLLFRYDEHLASEAGVQINESQWARVWASDPARSVEHVMPQSSGKGYIHNLGNLVLLPPGLNSSLKDKPPQAKATRYIESGLQATIAVGLEVRGGLRWNKRAVLKRAASIEQFVRLEWGN